MTLDYTIDGVTWEVTIIRKGDNLASSEAEADRPPVIPIIIVYPDGSTGTLPPKKP